VLKRLMRKFTVCCRILALPRSAAVSQTSRSSLEKPVCGNMPDAAEPFHMLRLVLCTQPRSSRLRREIIVLRICRICLTVGP